MSYRCILMTKRKVLLNVTVLFALSMKQGKIHQFTKQRFPSVADVYNHKYLHCVVIIAVKFIRDEKAKKYFCTTKVFLVPLLQLVIVI